MAMALVVAAIALAIPGVAMWLWGRRLVSAVDAAEWMPGINRALPKFKLLTAAIAVLPWLLDVRWPALWSICAWLSWRAGCYPLSRVMRGKSWSLARCLWFDVRTNSTNGFWLLLAGAPMLIADGLVGAVPLGIALLIWARYGGHLLRALLRVQSFDRSDVMAQLNALVAPDRVGDFRVVTAGPTDAVWAKELAWPHDRVILLSRTLCDRLSADELTALGVHALVRLDLYGRRRPLIPKLHAGQVLFAVVFAPFLPLGPLGWIAYVVWFRARAMRRAQAALRVFDRPTAEQLGDGEPLISALVATAALELPRQLDAETSRRLAAESLRERIAAIRAPRVEQQATKVAPTTAPQRGVVAGLLLGLRLALAVVALGSALVFWRVSHTIAPAANAAASSTGVPLSGMGKSYGHIVLHGPTAADVAAAVADRQAAISPTVNGYTLVADESFLTGDGTALAAELSQNLHCPAVVVAQYHDDVLYYTLFEAGKATDDYNSEPDYYDFAFAHIPPRSPMGGDAERLSDALGRHDAHATVDRALHKRGWLLDASDRHRELVDALGMPKFAVGFGYGALHGTLPDGLDEVALVLTTKARQFRDIEKRLTHPLTIPRRESEMLPSGKRIDRNFRPDGSVLDEFQSHADAHTAGTAIGVRSTFRRGHKTGEGYFVNKRLAPREAYEREQPKYPDMPHADKSVDDAGTERMVVGNRQIGWRHSGQPPEKLAADMDQLATEMMSWGRRVNAVEWVQANEHTIGDFDVATSRFLAAKLVELGAVAVHACRVRSYPDGFENTDHLVIELPTEPEPRAAVIKVIEILTATSMLGHYPDYGQRYAYVKLD